MEKIKNYGIEQELKNILQPKVSTSRERYLNALDCLSKAADLFDQTGNIKQADKITEILSTLPKEIK